MASEQHLQIINPTYRGSGSFSLFPRLPVELRLDIWQLSLKHWRLLNITLAPKQNGDAQDQDSEPQCTTQNALGNVVSGECYQVVAKAPKLLSKLLRVNREARQAALGFYRVHLPCRLVTSNKVESIGILPFNPEFDVLHVKPGKGDHDFVHFLHDIRALDKLGVGLLNLALDLNGINNLFKINNTSLECAGWAAFASTLLNLRQIFFVTIESVGRIYHGARSGIHTNDRYEFHRSRPIMPGTVQFDRLHRDPRDGLERDLSRTYVGTPDPRQTVHRWQELLTRWKIQYEPQKAPEYGIIVSTGYATGSKNIVSREAAAEWLRREEERWINGQQRHASRILAAGHKLPLESPDDLEKAPRPAIGFWVFPIEAIEALPGPEAHADNIVVPWQSKRMVDMRKYWPELWLARMT
ncbi:hypothetical protein F5Y10DRAFT_57614 [Nemania abortiva]|nr:hypothetical protein F5Y10DRAFT_57614 [Nemania abortiva]